MTLLLNPLLAQLKIRHGSTIYTISSELISADVSLSVEKASTFEATFDDPNREYVNTFKPGDEVEVWVGRSAYSKILTGFIERIRASRRFRNVEVNIGGSDYSQRLLQRIVKAARYGTASGGVSEVSQIVRDLLSVETLGEPSEEITANNVQNTGYTIQEIRFSYKPLIDCIKQLADIVKYTFYIDADKDLHFTDRFNTYSGLTFTEEEIVAAEVEEDVEQVKNRVYVLGGDEIKADIEQTAASTPVSLHDKYWADEFTPQIEDLVQIALYIDKVGHPTSPLQGELRYDSNGPLGPVIRAFELSASRVGSGWHILDTSCEVTRGQLCWIVLYKTGDVNNTYRWYSDGSSDKKDAYSVDGLNWNVRSNSGQNFAFKTYWREPLIAVAKNQSSVNQYRVRETVVSDPQIKTREEAKVEAFRTVSK
ncbi:MAG: hypothetical protein QXJ86_06010, partial [Nitrososphaerales archaeon]